MEQKKQHSALLVMDVQHYTMKMMPENNAFLSALSKAIAAARKHDIPVIYVVVGFRKGYPEVSAGNKSFSALKTGNVNLDDIGMSQVYSAVAPVGDEVIITKRRVSAFSGSDLEVVLRAMEIDRIVLTGIATSGVVLSTVREAADKDYSITVLSDACADRDEEVHRVLMTKVFVRQADVITVDEFQKMITEQSN